VAPAASAMALDWAFRSYSVSPSVSAAASRSKISAARLGEVNGARLLENLRNDPHFEHVQRIAAEPPLGIDDDQAAAAEIKDSLENLRKEAAKASEGQRVRTHTFGGE
jgi:hypothetical protein